MNREVRKLEDKVVLAATASSFIGGALVLYSYFVGKKAGALEASVGESVHLPTDAEEEASESSPAQDS